MKFNHQFTVPTDVASAWELLLDLPRVAQCMPGASVESVEGDKFTGVVKVKLGPMQVVYRGAGAFEQLDESAHTIVVGVQAKESRGTGTAKATITVQLDAAGTATQVHLRTDLAITGRPAQLGRGLLDDVATQVIANFAANLAREIRGEDAPVGAASGSEDVLDVSGIGTAVLLRRGWPVAAGLVVLVMACGLWRWARRRAA